MSLVHNLATLVNTHRILYRIRAFYRPLSSDMPKRHQTALKPRVPRESGSRLNVVSEMGPEQTAVTADFCRPTSPGGSDRLRLGAYPFVPVILALVTSVNWLSNTLLPTTLEQVLGNPFIKHLGNIYPPHSQPSVLDRSPAADIVFTVDPYFRPIFSSLFTLNYALFGTAPWGWHLVEHIDSRGGDPDGVCRFKRSDRAKLGRDARSGTVARFIPAHVRLRHARRHRRARLHPHRGPRRGPHPRPRARHRARASTASTTSATAPASRSAR